MAAHASFRLLRRVAAWLAGLTLGGAVVVFLTTGLVLHRSPVRPVGPEDRVTEVDGVAIRYRIGPETGGLPVIFLHGFGGSLHEWEKVAALLPDTRWMALDLPGFGGSGRPVVGYDLENQSARLIRFMDTLGIEQAILAGQSMGASLAAWTAAHHPERVAGIVLVAPSGVPGSLRYPFPLSLFYRPGLPNTMVRGVVDNALFARVFPTSLARQALGVTASYNQAFLESLAAIQAPTTLIWSRGDERVPFDTHREFVTRIHDAAFIEAPERAGHAVASHAPETIASAVSAARFARGQQDYKTTGLQDRASRAESGE